MFGFLREKLKRTIKNISGKVKKEDFEEESLEKLRQKKEIEKVEVEEKENLKREEGKKEEKKNKEIEKKELKKEIKEKKEQFEERAEEKPKERKGFFKKIKERITTTKISEKKFEDIFYELEIVLLENNIAFEVVEKIKRDLKEKIVNKPLKKDSFENIILDSLKESINSLFKDSFNLIEKIRESKKRPFVICFFGVNGSGKTTTIAKIANKLKKEGFSCVLAAADTFRAASIEQLQYHANKLGIKLIKHDYNADPAAVAFDAIKHAEAKGIDVVLIDTAGRMHSNENLIEEMKKIVRVNKPDLKIFVGEAITGNDCVEQAKRFNETVGIDAIILAKGDIDEKGGAFVSISYVTGKPIIYVGTGQGYEDIEEFDKEKVIKSLGLESKE